MKSNFKFFNRFYLFYMENKAFCRRKWQGLCLYLIFNFPYPE